MYRILFRTAGGKAKGEELGLGHIFRTINLSKQLKNCKKFFLIEDFGGTTKILKNNGIEKIKKIKKGIDYKEDYEITQAMITKWKIDIVVIDRFKISKTYVKKLKKIVKVVVISDLQDYQYTADLVVNGFVGFKNKIIKNRLGARCFLGPKYQILNKEFTKKPKKMKKWDLLITFGGYDEKMIADRLRIILSKYLQIIKVKMILGPVAKKNKKLQHLEKKFSKNLCVKKSTNNMANEMSDVRYGLCTGGLTTYEFASLGIPMGIIPDENHQILTANNWKKIGHAENLGIIDKISDRKIECFLQKVSEQKIPKIKYSVIDGKGATRIANEILKIKLKN